jgi:protein TonB
MGRFFGISSAILLHVGVLLFGGLLFLRHDGGPGNLQQVELLSAPEKEPEKKDDPAPETDPSEALETEQEEAPDAAELLRNLDLSATVQADPGLEAASLAAIADALNGIAGGSGDFGEALTFASGGRIGGTGKPGAMDETLEGAFSLTEIDQRPRAVFQSAPLFPSEMRGKKLAGVVTLVFVVDAGGKVTSPRVEKSTHPAFEKPALDAVRQWRFEPAVRSGQRVPCKMRIPIRFQPS